MMGLCPYARAKRVKRVPSSTRPREAFLRNIAEQNIFFRSFVLTNSVYFSLILLGGDPENEPDEV
jgi:hypothetical protein